MKKGSTSNPDNHIDQEIADQKKIISSAQNNVRRSIKALEKLGINVSERHNVLVPGTPTTPENSKSLLKKAIRESGKVSVYCGITVCKYICKFCRYYNRTGPLENLEQMAGDDVEDIVIEMQRVADELGMQNKIKTPSIYIGGGTPTLLSKGSMRKLFDKINEIYEVGNDTEITIECTPDTITADKINALRQIRVNRISMGVQRLNDEWLKFMNRKHSSADVFQALKLLNESGIKYNIDLMYGFDGQTIESFCKDIVEILKYSPEEMTLYRLETQKRTDDKNIKVLRSNSELTYSMQEAGRMILNHNGYIEGPDGWFTRKDVKRAQVYEDRWKKQIPLLGFGPEAYSYSKYQQHTNKPFRDYREAIKNNGPILDTKRVFEYVGNQQEMRRIVFELKSHFETSFDGAYKQFFESLSNAGLGDIQENNNIKTFQLNKYGIIVVEEIMRALIEQKITKKILNKEF